MFEQKKNILAILSCERFFINFMVKCVMFQAGLSLRASRGESNKCYIAEAFPDKMHSYIG